MTMAFARGRAMLLDIIIISKKDFIKKTNNNKYI